MADGVENTDNKKRRRQGKTSVSKHTKERKKQKVEARKGKKPAKVVTHNIKTAAEKLVKPAAAKEVVQAGRTLGGDDEDFEETEQYVIPDAEDESGSEGDSDEDQAAAELPLKQKAKKQAKPKKRSAAEFEASRELAAEISTCTPEQQAKWLWENYAASTGASFLEKDAFTGASVVALPQEGSLEGRLRAVESKWTAGKAQMMEHPRGSPCVLIISQSAVGANNLAKRLPGYNAACRVGKLFAKHFKVEEQLEYLQKQVVVIATGTPNRLCKLADLSALRLDRLRLIVIDVQLDAKQRTILDIPETQKDFWMLFSKHLQARIASGTTKLALIDSDSIGN